MGTDSAGTASPVVLRYRPLRVLVAYLVLLLAMFGIAAPAAKGSKVVVGTIGQSGSLGGQLNEVAGVAVDDATGDLYVIDHNNSRIQKFDSSGQFVRTWGKDVDSANPSTGFEVCTAAEDCNAGAQGDLGGELTNPRAVAVDNGGNVWVAEPNRVQKFSADGDFLFALGRDVRSLGGGTEFEICAVAADCKAGISGTGAGELAGVQSIAARAGQVYVADAGNRRVQSFDQATGAFELAFGWNVDPVGGEGGLETCAAVCRAGSAGMNLGQFDRNSPEALAIDSGGFLYTTDGSPPRVPRIQKFSPARTAAVLLAPDLFARELGDPGNTFREFMPRAGMTIDPQGDDLYAVAEQSFPDRTSELRVLQFSYSGSLLHTHAAGAHFGRITGIAVDPASANLYVAEAGADEIFVLNEPIPPTATIGPTDAHTHGATFHGEVNPNGFSTSYHFEYSSDGERWTKVSAMEADAGDGTEPVAVSVDVEGLVANTTYQVRLVATKARGGGVDSSEEQRFTTAPATPVVSGLGAVNISNAGAVLIARVHPENDATTYRFEYGRSRSYGRTVPIPAGDIPSGLRAVKVAHALTDLVPGATYHARIVATNSAGTTQGPDASFKTLPAPAQGRGYELVSPPDKGGGEVALGSAFAHAPLAADDGETAAFVSEFAFGDPEAAWSVNPYRAARDSKLGWSSEPILPARGVRESFFDTVQGNAYLGYSPDLAVSMLDASYLAPPFTADAVEGANSIYRRSLDPTGWELTTPGMPPVNLFGQPNVDFAGGDDDFSTVLAQTPALLSEDASQATAPYLFVWDRQNPEEVSLVGYLPNGTVSPDAVAAASPGDSGGRYPAAISADGSRIFFNTPTAANSRRLYMRDVDAGATTFVSQEENSNLDPAGVAEFWAASEDGLRAFFSSPDQLVDADTDASDDLYLYAHSDDPAEDSRNLTLVSDDEEPADGDGADVMGVLGASEDGLRVYFAASGQLVAGESTVSGPKIYLWDATGAEPTLTYIATLGTARLETDRSSDLANWDVLPSRRTSRITPNGRVLVFESNQDLTDFESELHRQIYRYDAELDQLHCASCDPTEAKPEGHSALNGAPLRGAAPNGWVTRNLSADGSRVFFESPESLLPQDVNGRTDVYLFEDERLKLISTGTGSGATHFADASVSGDDVFFLTRQRLVSRDRDRAGDLYDARVGGGFPEPQAPVSCEGSACRGLPAPPPLVNVPASMAPARGGGKSPSGSPPSPSKRCGKLKLRVERTLKRVKRLRQKAKRASRADHRQRAKRLRRKTRRVRDKGRKARKQALRCRREAR